MRVRSVREKIGEEDKNQNSALIIGSIIPSVKKLFGIATTKYENMYRNNQERGKVVHEL